MNFVKSSFIKFITFLFLIFYCVDAVAQNTAVIKVINRTENKTLYLQITKWNKSFTDDLVILAKEDKINDSVSILKIDNIKKPELAELRGAGINAVAFISPNDRITATIEKRGDKTRITFIGKNAVYYRYYLEQDSVTRLFKLQNAHNWHEFKGAIDSLNAGKNAIKNKYMRMPLSIAFKKIIAQENTFNYYSLLDIALALKKNFTDTTLPKQLINIKKIPFKTFTDTTLLNSRIYTLGLISLLNLINNNPGPHRSEKNLVIYYRTISQYFTGETKEYLWGNLLYSYAHNARMVVDSSTYNYVWQNAFKNTKNAFYKDWMVQSKDLYFKVNRPFPLDVQQTELKDDSGKNLTLKDLLAKYRGKPIIFDFWATWCGPCKGEFVSGRDVVNSLQKQGYQFVYISIDRLEDFNKMKSDAQTYGLSGHDYILTTKANELNKFLKINSIPRYVVVDSKGIVKALFMPTEPSDRTGFQYNLSKLH